MIMMKTKDVAVATALIIGGYLRAADDGRPDKNHLADCLQSIRMEIDDWAENIASESAAISHDGLTVDIRFGASPVGRTSHNLVSAAIALLLEAQDLNGSAALDDLRRRAVAAGLGEI